MLGLEVAHDCQTGVVGSVIEPEEIPHVFQFGRLDVLVRADYVAVVGMALGIEQMEHSFVHDSVRSVLDALAPFVAHHVLLIGKAGLIQFVGQVAHAVGLQPQRQLELIRGQCFKVIGAVKIGGAVDVARTCGFQ